MSCWDLGLPLTVNREDLGSVVRITRSQEERVCMSSRNKMPNKKKNNAARNAFYFFMVSLKPQLERQGVVLENGMQSLAEIAGPRWKVLCFSIS